MTRRSRPQPRPRAALLSSVGLALGVGSLHFLLLLTELAIGASASELALTGGSVAWWWGSATYQLLRPGQLSLVERRAVLSGHAAALTVVGLLSDVPGEPWACSMGLVALPLGAALSQNRRTVAGTLVLSGLGSGAVVLAHTQPLALGLYCTLAVLITTVLPTVLYLRLRSALRSARDDALVLALTDPLTGLVNRRGLEQRLPALRTAAPPSQRVAVVLLDLDHFKLINDQHGHETGDEVLVHVAALLQASARQLDLVVRLGGEELAWVGTWPDEESAVVAADRFRAALAASTAPHGCTVSASAGVAFSTDGTHAAPHVEALSRLLVRADAALYEAKRTGRDRVVLAPSTLPDGSDPHHDLAPAPQVRDGGSERAGAEGQRA